MFKGTLHHITCLRDARCALSTIVNQGEGLSDNKYADENEAELTHFAKLEGNVLNGFEH